MSITGGFRFAVRIVGMNTRQAENILMKYNQAIFWWVIEQDQRSQKLAPRDDQLEEI